MPRCRWLFSVVALTLPVFSSAAVIDVPAGDVAALRVAIGRANENPGTDRIRLAADAVYRIRDRHAGGLALPPVHSTLIVDGRNATLTLETPRELDRALRFLRVTRDGDLTLRRITLDGRDGFSGGDFVAGGDPPAPRGGVDNRGRLTLTHCTLRNGMGGSTAAGLLNRESGRARVVGCELADNLGEYRAPADIDNRGRLELVDTTLAGETPAVATVDGTSETKFLQRVRFSAGGFGNTGEAALTNVTSEAEVFNSGTLSIATSTLARVRSPARAPIDLATSIVREPVDCDSANIVSRGHNIFLYGTCPDFIGDSDRQSVRPGLGRLTDVGARVRVRVPEASSPAVDGGPRDGCPARDARGEKRGGDGDHDGIAACDVGAVERVPEPFIADARANGVWFQPGHDGHFFNIELVDTTRAVVVWSTFDAAGDPLWLSGVGEVEDNRIEVELFARRGMRFGVFDPAAVDLRRWGRVRIELDNCRRGRARWQTQAEGGESGEIRLARLTTPAGYGCKPRVVAPWADAQRIDIPNGDLAELRRAIADANTGDEAVVLRLAEGGDYAIGRVNELGHPVLRIDGRVRIVGRGARPRAGEDAPPQLFDVGGRLDLGAVRIEGFRQGLFVSRSGEAHVRHSVFRGMERAVRSNGGTLILRDSSVIDNARAEPFGAAAIEIDNGASSLLENVTVSGNRFPVHYNGDTSPSGIWVREASVVIVNSTIANNTVVDAAADSAHASGLLAQEGSTVVLRNSLLAGNGPNNCALSGRTRMTSNAGNRADDATCGPMTPNGQQPIDAPNGLSALADNGGPVPTHALPLRHPAIDAGIPADCPRTDARGAFRPEDGDGNAVPACDAGAFERGGRTVIDRRMTGLWVNPDQDGHFLVVQYLGGERVLALWLTYDAGGQPLWLTGVGVRDGARVTMPLTARRGPMLPDLAGDDLESESWGGLTVSFSDCRALSMQWRPGQSGFTAGSTEMVPLTKPLDSPCS